MLTTEKPRKLDTFSEMYANLPFVVRARMNPGRENSNSASTVAAAARAPSTQVREPEEKGT